MIFLLLAILIIILFISIFSCKHDYEYVDYRIEEGKYVSYSVKLYKCKKCGHMMEVDIRNKDTYFR